MSNFEVMAKLEEVAVTYETAGKSGEKFMAAIRVLRGVPYKVLDNLDKLQYEEAIDATTRVQIIQFLRTGAFEELDRLRQHKKVRAFAEWRPILGTGAQDMESWYRKGLRGLADLRRAVADGRINLRPIQRCGLYHYADLTKRIPRSNTERIADDIMAHIVTIDPTAELTIAGSYRRGAASSGDVDLIVRISELDGIRVLNAHKLEASLSADPNYVHTVLGGTERLTVLWLCDFVAQVDVIFTTGTNYWTALSYFTGSYQHNEWLRGIAKARGYRLNQTALVKFVQRGAYRVEEIVDISSEKDIYDELGQAYIAPENR